MCKERKKKILNASENKSRNKKKFKFDLNLIFRFFFILFIVCFFVFPLCIYHNKNKKRSLNYLNNTNYNIYFIHIIFQMDKKYIYTWH